MAKWSNVANELTAVAPLQADVEREFQALGALRMRSGLSPLRRAASALGTRPHERFALRRIAWP